MSDGEERGYKENREENERVMKEIQEKAAGEDLPYTTGPDDNWGMGDADTVIEPSVSEQIDVAIPKVSPVTVEEINRKAAEHKGLIEAALTKPERDADNLRDTVVRKLAEAFAIKQDAKAWSKLGDIVSRVLKEMNITHLTVDSTRPDTVIFDDLEDPGTQEAVAKVIEVNSVEDIDKAINTILDTATSDGSTASYYQLPPWATELQHLISYKDMNSQIGTIFSASYRYGESSHSDKLRDARKIKFYIDAEIERLENSGEYRTTFE